MPAELTMSQKILPSDKSQQSSKTPNVLQTKQRMFITRITKNQLFMAPPQLRNNNDGDTENTTAPTASTGNSTPPEESHYGGI